MASTDFTPPHVYEQPFPAFDINAIETPAYVVDVALLRKNMEKLARVQSESGARVLLALKGFSMFSVFPIMREYLSGCCASGLNEALLAQEFGKEVHVYAPAFKEKEMREIIPISHHLSFNSLAQFRKFKPMLDAAKAVGHAPSPGIRVNPEHSEVEVSLYDPCSPGCRLGIRSDLLEGEDLTGVEGLHFHALCEQDSDVLERTVAAVERRFPRLLEQVQWVNMGGGHHITRKDYDVDLLIRVLRTFREKWGKDVYIEPGEAAGLNTGYLIAEVQDIIVGDRKSTVVTANTHTNISHGQDRPRPQLFRPAADARHAAAGLRGCLTVAEGKLDHPDAAQRIHAETESLLEWARENDCLITAADLALITAGLEELEGASEHDVCVDHVAGRVLKWTKPPNFGARGSAVGYLENILACNAVLVLDWRFEAVVQADDGVRILSSQPFILGENASVEEIDAYFAALGFSKERENTYVRPDGLKVADARPDNLLRRPNGALIPIDVHVLGVAFDDLPDEDEAPEALACESVVPTVILDISATAHMPDTLEMPYRPYIFGSGLPGEHPYEYKMGGMSCLAGDVLSGFSFPEPLRIGQRLVFADMAHYTMVKTTTFNGVPHPDIAIYDPATQEYRVVRRFGYADFRNKLS